jgi:uncharacterized protein (DUF58 family)
MTFGTAQRRKADVAEGVVLAFGHLTTRGGGRVGLLTFGGSNPRTLPPRGGRVGMLGVLAHARREPAASEVGATSLGEAFRRIFRLARRRGLVVVVSDFRGPRDWWGPIVELVGRHEVIAVEIRDPREQELPDVGDLFMVDPETGRQLRVNTASRRLRERFASEAKKEREELARELARAGVGHLVLSTDSDWLRELARFLLLGKARKRGPR